MFDYHCNVCGHEFFLEEGYDANTDAIVCPVCQAIRYSDNDDWIIEEVQGK